MDLAARIARIEDIEAIKQLKARYCEICDDDHNPDHITTIFTEDGVWDGADMGKATGHAELHALFTVFQKSISYSQHNVMNPIIEIDGDRATGRWAFFGPFTHRATEKEGGQAVWGATRYLEEYARVDGVWKIKQLQIVGPSMSANYETGWANGS